MATATAFLELNITGFEKAIASAKRALTVLGSAFLTYKSVKFLEGQAEEALDFAQSLFQVSRAMGNMDTGQLLLSQKALEQIGYSASGATARIQELVGAGIPLSVTFGGAANYSNQLQQAAKMWGNSANILSKVGDGFSMVWDRLQAVFAKGREFLLGMLSGFIEPLKVLFDKILTMDLASIGEKFGKSIGEAITLLNGAMANGSIGEIISASFTYGTEKIIQAFEAGGYLIMQALNTIGVLFDSAVVSINWGNLLVSAFGAVERGLLSVFEMIARAINAAVGQLLSAIGILSDEAVGESDTDLHNKFTAWKDTMPTGGSIINSNTSDIGPIMKAQFEVMAKNIKEAMGEDTPEAKVALAKLNALIASAKETGRELEGKDGKGNMGTTKADPFKVIGDSLARIGGGGGAIRVGMTIEAKNSILIARATKQAADNTKIMADAMSAKPHTPGYRMMAP